MHFEIVDTLSSGAKWLAGILVVIIAVWFIAGILFSGPSDDGDKDG